MLVHEMQINVSLFRKQLNSSILGVRFLQDLRRFVFIGHGVYLLRSSRLPPERVPRAQFLWSFVS